MGAILQPRKCRTCGTLHCTVFSWFRPALHPYSFFGFRVTLPAHCMAHNLQGVPGAYSEMAALKACPGWEPLPCEQFETAFQALTQVGSSAELAAVVAAMAPHHCAIALIGKKTLRAKVLCQRVAISANALPGFGDHPSSSASWSDATG